MIDSRVKDSFWHVVEDCLIEFHLLPPEEARTRCHEFRETVIEAPPPGVSSDMFYHAEPFDVACDMAQRELNVADHWSQYELILARHNW